MRFRWKYLELLGGILIVFGMLAVLPGCPYFGLFPPIIYGRCDLSSLAGETGFGTAVAGTVLFISRPVPGSCDILFGKVRWVNVIGAQVVIQG